MPKPVSAVPLRVVRPVPSRERPFLNRELSSLAFHERVLEEAQDPTVPLFERMKFAAIVASNLDEFFMVRVAKLMRASDGGDTGVDLAGLTPDEQLRRVQRRSRALMETVSELAIGTLLPALEPHGVRLVSWDEVGAGERTAIEAYFHHAVEPILTPLAIDVSRPFPLLSSLSLNLALVLDPEAGSDEPRLAIVQVPSGLPRLVRVPETDAAVFIPLEEAIRAFVSRLFPGQTIREVCVIRLSRDAELELDDDEDGRTQLELVERQLKERRRSDVIRLEIEREASPELTALLIERLDISAADVYRVRKPLDLRLLSILGEQPVEDPSLRDPPLVPVCLVDSDEDIFARLDERDVLLHHPYDAFDPVLDFVRQAADDPDVLAIKMTLYRVSAGSPIIASLRRAAEHNKQVTVLVELTARFDEERNIRWARSLEEAGAHVIYGLKGFKTHAKMCLVVRRTAGRLRRYVHLGTGNYNERTARLYTDIGLMTASPAVGDDVAAVFNALTGYSDPPKLKRLAMAPVGLRQRFLTLIRREQRIARAGQPAAITAKMNSLVDREIIAALYAASRAGVTIRLNVRGICALRPGVPAMSETIEVISVVDRFLEHSRIFHFHNAGNDEVYLSSADWMTRNFDRRVEVLFPVAPDDTHKLLVALDAMFRDTVKARRLEADGSYVRVRPAQGARPFRVQQYLQRKGGSRLKAHGSGKSIRPAP